MKSRVTSFFAGMLTVLLLGTLAVSALAAGGPLSLSVHPIQVMVNGEIFQPKDAQGGEALVFAYNGTAYAPLRALAEAYGLEVSYDAASNLAAVSQPDSAAPAVSYEEFSGQWTVKELPVTNYGDEKIFTAVYSGPLNMNEFKAWWKSMDESFIQRSAEQMAEEMQSLVPGFRVTAYFTYNTYNLGAAYALDGYALSNFSSAKVWIK